MTEFEALRRGLRRGVEIAVNLEFSRIDIRSRPSAAVREQVVRLRCRIQERSVDTTALTTLLVEKGIITAEESNAALLAVLREAVEIAEREVSAATGKRVKLLESNDEDEGKDVQDRTGPADSKRDDHGEG